MFVSPLKRAAETGEIVWGGRRAPRLTLPSLREIDLYTFQARGRAGGAAWRTHKAGAAHLEWVEDAGIACCQGSARAGDELACLAASGHAAQRDL